MKRFYLVLLMTIVPLLVGLACAASAPSPTPTPVPTVNPFDYGMTLVAGQVNANATSDAIGLHWTATAQVVGATSTQVAYATNVANTQQARIDAQATSDQERADAQATQQRADADAHATQQRIDFESTQEQARRDAQATSDQARLDLAATQQAQATVMAFSMTQAVAPTHNLWTQEAVEQNIRVATNEVELSNLKVQQQQQTNVLQWALPMVIAVALTIGLLIWGWNHSQVREIKNGDGDTEVIIFKNQKAVKPKLFAKPTLLLTANNDDVDKNEQSAVTKRAQAIEALANMPVNPTSNAVGAFNSMFTGQTEQKKLPVIEISTPDQVGKSNLEEVESQVMEEGDN